jgi:CHAT domain-containing protein
MESSGCAYTVLAGHQPVRVEGDDPVVREIERLDVLLVGGFAEVKHLALAAPEVAGVKGDGLVTMEKILALRLDADWVVLSACNTAAGAGAEAAFGLGSAFFYAGTRAFLVTNWSVHSASARELITDLFRRQRADPTLTRSDCAQP